ncbi:MAG: hypothetical protein OEY14_00290 [Myxococcales bacterium]|nr:hypothetical protein [Myxococcales bacterium]
MHANDEILGKRSRAPKSGPLRLPLLSLLIGLLGPPLLLSPSGAAAQGPRLSVGLGLGSGLTLGTGQGGVLAEHTPLFLEANLRTWSQESGERGITVLGGALRLEVDGRVAVAAVPRAELLLALEAMELRPWIGAPFFFAPFSLLGLEVGLGLAIPIGERARFVGAFLLDAFFWGSDLPSGGAIVGMNLSAGVELLP